jgi:murein L,D-transpeptidase YcbB/YkuD
MKKQINRVATPVFLLLAILLLVAPIVVFAGPLEGVSRYLTGADTIESKIAETLQADGRAVRKVVQGYEALILFYETRNFKPVWVSAGAPLDIAQSYRAFLADSWTHGLNPYRYHLKEIDALMAQKDAGVFGDLEVLLTDSYIRLGRDLSGIRINPAAMDTQKKFWKSPLNVEALLQELSAAKDPVRSVMALVPQGQTYQKLQEELRRLVRDPAPAFEAVLPIRLEGNLHPYQRSAAVPALRARLEIEAVGDVDLLVYEEALAAAVIQFQRENRIKADGIIGGQTLELLNRTHKEKIYQVIANLERLRWVDEKRPDKFVVVNIPSATLWAVKDGQVAFEMPVIVGRGKRPTNTFITDITGVRFNPNWTVPPTIKREDILPKLQADPTYLAQKGMQLIRGSGVEAVSVDPLAVDWVNMTEGDLKQFRMVQTPGAHNPLGRVRVLMPNVFNIYLHDTNQPEYFNRAARAESSGCVRLSEPEKMANFIMSAREGWSDAQMQALFESGKMKDLVISRPIKVYMLYYTIWIGEDGGIIYGNDLYGYDKKLIKILQEVDGVFVPVDNKVSQGG